MAWTELHATAARAAPSRKCSASLMPGAMAFVRCLTPDVVEALAADARAFAPRGWQVWRVADAEDARHGRITADHAVEIRESKGETPCCCWWILLGPAQVWTASIVRHGGG